MALISYDPPARFVAGTVGPPGQRAFFLQAAAPGRVTTVAVEKGQVAVLADRIDDLLDEFGGAAASADAAALFADDAPLDMPVDEEFRVGTIGLSWDMASGAVTLELHPLGEEFDVEDESVDPASDPLAQMLRIVVPAPMARAFARRARALVAAGRPTCPFCAAPIDPRGHICPRANGYRR